MLIPRNRSPGLSEKGLTLVELMVVVAIVAVSATLAAPDLSRMVANYRVNSEAESILNGLNLARAEAVRRNSAVRFDLTPGGVGWSISRITPVSSLQSHVNGDPGSISVTSSSANTSVSFRATGLLQAGPQMSQVTVASSVEGARTRRINIFGGGLIRMCDPGITAANDPRRC